MKVEQTECSETLAYRIQTPGNYSEEIIHYSKLLLVLHAVDTNIILFIRVETVFFLTQVTAFIGWTCLFNIHK